jgi:hypothetical protein
MKSVRRKFESRSRSDRHNQTLLWTGPRRVDSLSLVQRPLPRRVTRQRTLSVMCPQRSGYPCLCAIFSPSGVPGERHLLG